MGEFGDFIKDKRLAIGLSLRGFANAIGKAPSYISDIEKGNRNPNEKDLLDSIVKILNLSSDDSAKLYDLAASQKRNELAHDVTEYVNEIKIAKVALRTAKEFNATEEDWQNFINKLKEKNEKHS